MQKIFKYLLITFFLIQQCQAEEAPILKGNIIWSQVQDSEYENNLAKETTLFINLQTALEMALDKNLTIEVQEYQLKKSKDQLIGSGTEFLPSVSFANTMLRRDGNIQLFGSKTIPVNLKSVQPQIIPSFRLFSGGRVLFGFLASRKNLKAEKQNLNAITQNILEQTAISFFSVQRYKAELESELVRLSQAELNLKERKIARELGADIALSVLFAEQEVQQSKARVELLKGNLYTESSHLNNLLNMPSSVLILPVNATNEDFDKYYAKELINTSSQAEAPVKRLILQALMNSPDLSSLKTLTELYRAKKFQSISAFLPTIDIKHVAAWVGPEYGNLAPDKQYLLLMQYDILQNLGGKAISGFLLARHTEKQSLIKLEEQVKAVETQVTESYIKVISGKKIWFANKLSLLASEEAYKQSVARLKAEVGTPYEVKVSQSELEKARANYFDSLINYQTAQVHLLRVLGLANVNNLIEGINI